MTASETDRARHAIEEIIAQRDESIARVKILEASIKDAAIGDPNAIILEQRDKLVALELEAHQLRVDLAKEQARARDLQANNSTLQGCVERMTAAAEAEKKHDGFIMPSSREGQERLISNLHKEVRKLKGQVKHQEHNAKMAQQNYAGLKVKAVGLREVERLRRRLDAYEPMLIEARKFFGGVAITAQLPGLVSFHKAYSDAVSRTPQPPQKHVDHPHGRRSLFDDLFGHILGVVPDHVQVMRDTAAGGMLGCAVRLVETFPLNWREAFIKGKPICLHLENVRALAAAHELLAHANGVPAKFALPTTLQASATVADGVVSVDNSLAIAKERIGVLDGELRMLKSANASLCSDRDSLREACIVARTERDAAIANAKVHTNDAQRELKVLRDKVYASTPGALVDMATKRDIAAVSTTIAGHAVVGKDMQSLGVRQQPAVTRNTFRESWPFLIEVIGTRFAPGIIRDMRDRAEAGRLKYGAMLQPCNGRDDALDCYQELLDAMVYRVNGIATGMLEVWNRNPPPGVIAKVVQADQMLERLGQCLVSIRSEIRQ